jgi:hypothetical protein
MFRGQRAQIEAIHCQEFPLRKWGGGSVACPFCRLAPVDRFRRSGGRTAIAVIG